MLGISTPSELGAIATAYALLVGLLYRQLTWRRLREALINTVTMTSIIMYLFAVATALNFIVTRERVAFKAAEMMATYVTSPVLGLLAVNAFLVIVGMFLEGPIAILVMAPILLEVVGEFGMGPVQFGVMLSFNLLIGMMTPPMGIGLFVGARVAGTSPEHIFRSSMPFFIPLIITFVPAVTTWLPSLVFTR